jgi:hypothetical protein
VWTASDFSHKVKLFQTNFIALYARSRSDEALTAISSYVKTKTTPKNDVCKTIDMIG